MATPAPQQETTLTKTPLAQIQHVPSERRGTIGPSRPRRPISPGAMVRRRRMVATAKRLLPLGSVALLAALALWPQFTQVVDQGRLSLQQAAGLSQSGQMIDVTYHSVDEHGRPYTVTADSAREATPGMIELTTPKADVTQGSGSWLTAQAKHGVYEQHAGNLDVWGDVQLYRDDGTTLVTNSANIDLHSGAAAGSEEVHVEGPFGTLDAQSFTATDRGSLMQFAGPGRLVLNARSK